MGKNVFANGREVSAKADDNQSIAALPDVCLSPPSPPAGPIPIPYPNFSKASDTSNGTRSVKIGGKEVGQKQKSYYKTSKGDEAATRGLGMGVVTHSIQGKTYHAAWSMDVQVEDENVIRYLDLTTHNHASVPQNSGSLTIDQAMMALKEEGKDCEGLDRANREDRSRIEGSEELSDSKKKILSGGGSTITNFAFIPDGGGVQSAGATNRNESNDFDENHFQKGADDTIRDKKGSNLCVDFKYKGQGKRSSGHSESRIVETIFGGNPGSTNPGILLINVDLKKRKLNKFKKNVRSKLPCGHCHRLLCAAKKCEVKVLICDKDNNPQELTDDMCEEDPNASVRRSKRKRLKRLLGE